MSLTLDPSKEITSEDLLPHWHQTQGCNDLGGFIQTLTKAVKSTKMTETPLTDVSKPFHYLFILEFKTPL